MKEIKLKRWLKTHTVKVCDSIFEMNIEKYQSFQKILTLEIHSGTTIADIHAHYQKLLAFIEKDMKEQAFEEVNNIVAGCYFTLNNFDTNSNAFLELIHSVDGEPIGELDEVSATQLRKKLSKWGLTQFDVIETIEEVKKKLLEKSSNVSQVFQTIATNTNTKV